MGLTARFEATARIAQTGNPDLGTAAYDAVVKAAIDFADGVGAEQANLVFTDKRQVAASANDDLDLAGSLGGMLGGGAVFTAVKGLLIKAAKTNTNNVVIGGAPANGWAGPFADVTDKLVLKPGGCFLWADPTAAGAAVTAGTGDLLRIANSGAGSIVEYEIVILGES